MGKINTNNYPNRPVSDYQDDDMFILQDNGGETYTTNVGDIKTLIDNRVNDSNLVHKTGDETILGNKTFEDDINVEGGITAGTTSTFNDIELDGSSIYGVGTLNVNQIDVHDGQAVEFLTGITVNGAVADEDGNVLSNKTDKVTNATSGHLAGLDSNGNLTDSGVSPTEDVTVEGNPVTFDSPFEQDAKNVVVSVKPIQDLHGYDHPWVGGAGKNKAEPTITTSTTLGGVPVNPIKDFDNNILGLSIGSGTSNTDVNQIIANFVCTESGSYKIVGAKLNGSLSINYRTFLWDATASSIVVEIINQDEVTVSLTAEHEYVIGLLVRMNIGVTATDLYFMICKSSESSSFAPYSNICPISGIDEVEIEVSDGESEPTTTTIPLPSTLYDADVDVTEGTADSRFGFVVFDGSEDEGWIDDLITGQYSLPKSVFTNINLPNDSTNFVSNEFKVTNSTIGRTSVGTIWVGTYYINVNIGTVFTTLADFKAFLANSPLQICYPLATPTTISFDPTDVELLEGTNVVSTNAEKVAVTYGRSLWQDINDLKSDTEGKLDKSDVADIEGDTASKAYSVNDFMLRADGLYKVTQPIAQNASITASNTTKTTVGEVLTALLNA